MICYQRALDGVLTTNNAGLYIKQASEKKEARLREKEIMKMTLKKKRKLKKKKNMKKMMLLMLLLLMMM